MEVPHSHADIDPSQFRKRFRKPPGWLIRLQNHLPVWANSALVFSSILIALSVSMQAWMVTHADHSAILMDRAIQQYKSLNPASDELDVVKSCDRMIELWAIDSARLKAESMGLTEPEIRKIRREQARKSWKKRIERLSGSKTLDALEGYSKLLDESVSDSDLKDLTEESRNLWRTARDNSIQKTLDQCQAQMQANQPQESLKSLMEVEKFQLQNLEGVPSAADTEPRFATLVQALAKWRGMSVQLMMTESNFTKSDKASEQILPVIEKNGLAKGYLFPRFTVATHQDLFLKSALFRFDLQVSERYGRGFEETPHRTTLIEVRMNLIRDGQSIWNQAATTRTPRIPAKTAMGMSRLQLSKQSDERIERKLNEAAWESLPKPLNQSLQLLEGAGSWPDR